MLTISFENPMRILAVGALLFAPSCVLVVHDGEANDAWYMKGDQAQPDSEDVGSSLASTDVKPEPATEDFGMRSYWFGMILRGPNYNDERSETEAQELQAAHLARIGEIAQQGKMILAGPFGPQEASDDPYIGLFLYTVETREEAEALAASDPAVAAGRLRVEIVEWYGAAGITYPGNPVPDAAN